VQARLTALQERASAQEARLLSTIYPPGNQNINTSNQNLQRTRDQVMQQGSEHGSQRQSVAQGSQMQHPWCLEPQDTQSAARVQFLVILA